MIHFALWCIGAFFSIILGCLVIQIIFMPFIALGEYCARKEVVKYKAEKLR